MNISVALWLLRGAPLPDLVQWAVEHGCTGLALLETMMGADPGERAEAAAVMRARGMSVTYHANLQRALTPCNTLDHDRVDAVAADVLDWHARCGGVRACAIDPLRPAEPGLALALPANIMALRRLAARLGPAGIRAGIENGIGLFGDAHELSALAAVAGVPDLGLLLDAGHANVTARQAGVDIATFVRGMPLPILEVHLSDNGGVRDDHQALGTGTLDLPALLGALREVGVATQLTVEVCVDIAHQRYAADIRNPEEIAGMARSLAVLRAAVGA